MSVAVSKPRRAGRMASWLAGLALLLAVLGLLGLAAAPLVWRAGVLPLKTAFMLLAAGALLAMAAAVLAFLGLILAQILARASLGWPRIAALSCVLLLGIALAWAAWNVRHGHAPPINDITTDTEHPPAISAALPARQAEHAVSADYGGPAVVRQQTAAYPDIQPLRLAMPAAQAFGLALGTAKAMPDWRILAADQQAGRIEATQSSFWFGFVDDIVIRVAADSGGSRVDMRSHSRQGRGDLGVNAARIRRYMAALKQAAG